MRRVLSATCDVEKLQYEVSIFSYVLWDKHQISRTLWSNNLDMPRTSERIEQILSRHGYVEVGSYFQVLKINSYLTLSHFTCSVRSAQNYLRLIG